MLITLDARRAQLRRRRRRDALREWAALGIVAAIGVWLGTVAMLTLVSH
ncbi:MAG TPA: hypothetical protein VGQ42_10425 [Candidatus Dormibacteraeota bacterium]|nr:hypothetical protein [Candidatus Dormibacteraeota bacterium]